MPIEIRTATPHDSPAVSRLLGELGHAVPPEALPSRFAALAAGGGAAFVAADGPSPAVGLVVLARHANLHAALPVAYVTALVVATEARGRGVGRALLAAAERWARDRGCGRLAVTSAEHRAEAHAFYPRWGLPYTGRRYSKPLA